MKIRSVVAGIAVFALAACSGPTGGNASSDKSAEAPGASASSNTKTSAGGDSKPEVKTLTVLSHDSFKLPDELKEKFAKETGYQVTYTPLQDTGAMVNKLVLTKDSPLGDVAFGIDNTFASRASKSGVIEDYISGDLDDRGKSMVQDGMTPIDFGDVCVNADLEWFKKANKPLPKTLDDLTKPDYKGLFVTPSPATSSPGLAFLFATIGAKGEGWLDYWKSLKSNSMMVVAGWTEAYQKEFSAGEGKGKRPIVLSYSTSPAWTIGKDGQSTTVSLNDTCFRQVEFAAVLKGAKNPEGAKKFINFLLSPEVQASIPENMYMYPVIAATKLPEEWVKFAPLAKKPITLPSAEINKNRERWIREWTEEIS